MEFLDFFAAGWPVLVSKLGPEEAFVKRGSEGWSPTFA
jgi:hypothetical protein